MADNRDCDFIEHPLRSKILVIKMDIHSRSTYLSEFLAKNLSKHNQKHEWLFAQYAESPEHREDGKFYKVFVFRNKDRSIFGMKEFWEQSTIDFRQMASRVVTDATFRESLISDDEDLRKIWKKH